jgi:hypothetical protein
MIELGAYWAHYSMWLKLVHPDASVHLVEPELANLQVGKILLGKGILELINIY